MFTDDLFWDVLFLLLCWIKSLFIRCILHGFLLLVIVKHIPIDVFVTSHSNLPAIIPCALLRVLLKSDNPVPHFSVSMFISTKVHQSSPFQEYLYQKNHCESYWPQRKESKVQWQSQCNNALCSDSSGWGSQGTLKLDDLGYYQTVFVKNFNIWGDLFRAF